MSLRQATITRREEIDREERKLIDAMQVKFKLDQMKYEITKYNGVERH